MNFTEEGFDSDAAVRQMLDRVIDRDSFLAFVRELAADFYDSAEKEKVTPCPPGGPLANGWENGSIDAFLDAARQCAIDLRDRMPKEPSWKVFAEFLCWGKVYE